MKRTHPLCNVVLWLSLLAATATVAKADVLELVNGDHYQGTVIGMNQSNVVFQSEIQGRVSLPRDKVASIVLHEAAAPKLSVQTNAPRSLILYGTNRASSSTPPGQADAVLQQMRQQGIDPKIASKVQDQIFGQGSPEATQKYNELMGGLLSGTLSIQDIRAEAQNSIKEIQDLKKEIGDDDTGGMLDGYLGILQSFVQETATNAPAGSATTSASIVPTK